MTGLYSTAYLFPGQGSQRRGMGSDLFDRHRDLEAEADSVLGYSIRELCLEDPNRQLNETQHTQPALFVVNAMSYVSQVARTGKAGDMLAGHSLGEYNALHAAGVFDFKTGVGLTQKRGEIMSRAKGGGMAAVLGISCDEVAARLHDHGISTLDFANLNSPVQTVVSGLVEDIKRAATIFQGVSGCRFIVLRVSGAFHSRQMESARQEFESFLQEFELRQPQRMVISNVEARPYPAENLREVLARQITHPVKWMETIQVMMGAGIEDFRELGPGDTLTHMVEVIRQQAPPIAIDLPGPQSPRSDQERLLVAVRNRGHRPPLCLVHSLTGELTWLSSLATMLGSEQPIYGFAAPGIYTKGPFFSRLEEMAAAYLAALRSAQPRGPYVLGGYSFGGIVAFEMARQVQQAGQSVDRLILLDAYVPASSQMKALKTWDRNGTLLQVLANLLSIQWRATELLPAGDLPPGDPEAQVDVATRHLLAHCDVPHTYDELSTHLEKCQRVMHVHVDLLAAYKPRRPQEHWRSLLIHNTEGFVSQANALRLPQIPESGQEDDWESYLPAPPERVGVPTEHFLMVRPPALETIAGILNRALS